MKVIIDRETLRRRARLSHAASLGGLLVLLGSVAISLWKPGWTALTAILLVAGFAISLTGIYFANRWVKKPRPEDVLDLALKGLSDQHRLYHYALPCDHVLLTPTGLVVLEAVGLDGVFTYQNGKWRQKMSMGRAMRFFVEERLGDPISRAQACAQALKTRLAEELPEVPNLDVRAVVVFVHPNADFTVEKAPIPVREAGKLRGTLSKGGVKLKPEVYKQVQGILDGMVKISG